MAKRTDIVGPKSSQHNPRLRAWARSQFRGMGSGQSSGTLWRPAFA